MIKIILFLGLMFSSCIAQATTEFGAINYFTKQYTILEDGKIYTPIGWESVGENHTNNLKAYGENLGYTYTEYPYLIESVIAILCVLMASLILWYAIKKNYFFSSTKNANKKNPPDECVAD